MAVLSILDGEECCAVFVIQHCLVLSDALAKMCTDVSSTEIRNQAYPVLAAWLNLLDSTLMFAKENDQLSVVHACERCLAIVEVLLMGKIAEHIKESLIFVLQDNIREMAMLLLQQENKPELISESSSQASPYCY